MLTFENSRFKTVQEYLAYMKGTISMLEEGATPSSTSTDLRLQVIETKLDLLSELVMKEVLAKNS